MRNWDRLVDDYIEMYEARGMQAGTVQTVRRELDRLGCWLKNRRPRPKLEEVSADEMIAYIRSRTPYRAKATVAGIMSVLRGMGEYLVHRNVWGSNPLRWMKGPKLRPDARIPRRIHGPALQRLWEQTATGRQGYHRLRRGELQRLNVSDWCSEDGTLKIDGRKTGRQRQVAVPELTWRCVESYLPQRHNHLEALGLNQETALLINKDGGRLRGSSISRALKALARRAEIDPVTIHQFRHSCASDLLEKGVKLPQVQQILGHQTISTTVRYLHIADPARHEAVSRHPINEMLCPGASLATLGGAA